MNRWSRTLLMLGFSIIFSFLYSGISYAKVNIPEEIRIGIYYSDSATNTYKAVTSFTAGSDTGFEIGYTEDGGFTPLIKDEAKKDLSVGRDDAGAYHIKIGKTYKDYNAAVKKIKDCKNAGVDAYAAFDGKWQVWTGFFSTEADAQKQLTALKKKLKSETLDIAKPETSRIKVSSGQNQTLLIYEGTEKCLRLHPVTAKKATPVIKLNGSDYRGDMEVRRQSGSDMTVINVVAFEQYLYGVVPCEIGADSHPEALKAQAVTARTYALNELGKHSSLGFDLGNSTYDQVYKGMSSEREASNKAVDDTKGLVVTYGGKPAQVFYFSSSGGWTENNENVWGTPLPYLRSVQDKYESGKSLNYNWEVVYTADQIKQALLGKKIDIGDIVDVKITKVAESGRVTELVIKGTKGEKVYTKSGTRTALSLLNSQMYQVYTGNDIAVKSSSNIPGKLQLPGGKVATANGVTPLPVSVKGSLTVLGAENRKKDVTANAGPKTFTFKGKGWGHGVGLSQEGAKGMAEHGYKFDEILTYYFTGTKVE